MAGGRGSPWGFPLVIWREKLLRDIETCRYCNFMLIIFRTRRAGAANYVYKIFRGCAEDQWPILFNPLGKIIKEVISRVGNHELVIIYRDKIEITMG